MRSTHRDALIRALSQIKVETTKTPEGLIHMMTVGKATCIVFYDEDLPLEGLNHHVLCIPFVLLDNGSALNVCPLATVIASVMCPQTLVPLLRQSEHMIALRRRFGHIGDRVIDRFDHIYYFVLEGEVSSEPVLQISHSENDLFLIGFSFDEVHTLEIEDFCKYSVAMSFDQHSSTVVLDMMRSMSYLPGIGLGRRQHGPNEFIAIPDHEVPFGLEFISTKVDYQYVDDYLSDGALGTSTFALATPSSPDRMSLVTLYFLDEVDEHGIFVEIGDMGPINQRVPSAIGDIEVVNFDTANQPRKLRIGLDLSTDDKDSLVQLLKSYLDIFTWSYEDMRRLDPSLSSIFYHFCPMPDLFFGCNQILMALEDVEKTSFIIEWGTYYYRVMSFGLKKARATYQRAVTTLFHDMMHRDVEV
ncbi:hypothetical protein CK203_102655 [Vitis vinifera]|uniref:Uncharacterized protein n=1 Tax=Vitis vinifera TaxID=29760 RepID=A0A438C5X4_VITVI|nr:hypothetical protein CK203_102655 [Vitis vinifera]